MWWWRVQHYPRPRLLPKIGLLSPQCASCAKHCTPLSSLITTLLATMYLLQELREVPPFIFNVLYILQVVERDCDAQDGKKTSVDFQASPPEPWRPGNGHRGSQVCPSFPPHKKGQMSLNYFNRLQWVNYFRLQALPS